MRKDDIIQLLFYNLFALNTLFLQVIFCFFMKKGNLPIALCIFMVAIACCNDAMSQETATPDTVKKETKTKQVWNKIGEYIQLGGWIDAQYQYDKKGQTEKSAFQIRRARLDLKGSPSKWVDFRLQVDFAPNPRLIDAFVKVNFCKFVQLQVGQFKVPFSLENILSPIDLELTENAQVIGALSGYKDVTGISNYANGREIGLMLTGTLASAEVKGEKIPILQYGVGLFGGNGINVKTDNMAKDISGRILFSPFVKGLNISVSGYYGRYDMLFDGTSSGVDGNRHRVAAGLQYDNHNLIVRSEYLCGVTDFAVYDADRDEVIPDATRTHGAYLTIGYWVRFGWSKNSSIQQKLRPVLRVDYYKQNLSVDNASLYYSAGVDWWPEKHVRMQVNYTLRQQLSDKGLGHLFTTMVTVKF